MTHPHARKGFRPVYIVAAIALAFAGTMVVTSDRQDPAYFDFESDATPSEKQPILWNVG